MYKSNMKQLFEADCSAVMSSSLPIIPKLPESQQVSMEKELCGNPVNSLNTHFVSNSGVVGPLFSSDSGLTSDYQFSPIPQSQYSLTSMQSTCSSDIGSFQSLACYSRESNEAMGGLSTFQTAVDYSDEVGMRSNTIQSSSIMASDELSEQNEWWTQLVNEDWKDILNETAHCEPHAKVTHSTGLASLNVSVHQPQISQTGPCSGSAVTSSSTSATGASPKARMRWTPELHESFVQAVNQLGGSEKATPKGVLKLMKVDGLTIYHVKSHLQKYRTARFLPDSSEGTSERRSSPLRDFPSLDLKTGMEITEALRLQMDVQKRLHEQLEIQRKLQLRIEEQGRHLQMMLEKQCKSGTDQKLPTRSSNNNLSEKDHGETENPTTDQRDTAQDSRACKKKKKPDIEQSKDEEAISMSESQSPPSKRSRVEDQETKSEGSA